MRLAPCRSRADFCAKILLLQTLEEWAGTDDAERVQRFARDLSDEMAAYFLDSAPKHLPQPAGSLALLPDG
jgi:hypothetical protein